MLSSTSNIVVTTDTDLMLCSSQQQAKQSWNTYLPIKVLDTIRLNIEDEGKTGRI